MVRDATGATSPLERAARRSAELPLHYNAIEILEHNLDVRPDKIALVTPAKSVSFRGLGDEVNRVGNVLRDLGVRPGECVGILCPDGIEWAASFFACLKIGAVAVGLNTLLGPREHAYMLSDARVRVLIVHEAFVEATVGALGPDSTVCDMIVVGDHPSTKMSYATLVGRASPRLEATNTHRDDFGSLNYSSGTTGTPKGIFHSHQDYALTAQLWAVDVLGLREDDRTFSVAKLFFVFGLGGNLIFPLYVGATTVLFPGSPRDPVQVLNMIDAHRPTILFNAPTGYAAMLAEEDLTTRWDLSCLRLGVSAGEALPAPLWHRFKDRTGIDLLDGIGSTENFHIFVSNRPGDVRPGSSGKPVPGYECRVVGEDGSPAPVGEVGNLHVKGETSALFYLHDPERSRRTFLGPWMDTGDKYRADEDGYYWHAGRSDDMLKVGGIWVSPVEVESTLLEHEAVLECAVTGERDDRGLVKPKGWVVLKEAWHVEADGIEEALMAHCVERMARFKRPRWIEVVHELPKTATGKIQRYKLR
jgi:benzoate-CoA ligase family protein